MWVLRNWKLVLLVALGVILGAMKIRIEWLDRKLEQERARSTELDNYRQQRKQADEVDEEIGDDPAAARQWLHDRNKRKP